ncbi:MAG TPA: glycosyltransferase family 39 protein [bacterium]|nr:glycosyltransferase family 39 protein [bacterium]HQG46475.1 glycosyltransferase family 39 protein [bacterium]HQI48314.1 glycosyltransferase family 39 protein [bacterium]HQJ64204.1 glycosyltransferase family 39 protein [bacterium]
MAGCILLSIALLAISLIYARDRQLAMVLLAGLILRTVLIYADHFIGFLPDQPDQVMYNNQALEILQSWSSGMYPIQTEEFAKGTSPFSYLLAVLYLPFGFMPLLGRLFNALISLLCVYYFYHIIVEILEERRIALQSSLLLAFLPSFIVFSSYILRDTLLILLSLIILYAIIKISKRHAIPHYTALLVFAFILNALLRIQNLFLYAGFFLFFLLARALYSSIDWKAKLAIILCLVAVPVAYYIYQSESFISVATYFFRAQPLRAEGGSAYLVDIEYRNFWDVARYLPIRFIFFCFGPFFWQAHGPVQWLTSVEGMFFLVVIAAALLYLLEIKKEHSVWLQYLVLGFALAGLLANAIVDSNFGTAVRHKLNYIILLFPFALMYLRKFRIRL